ncbi:hypothetical protein HT102_10280 [Hoyosella sp. G463]|uniref:Uncharacterized protein n=1 Tax=Lolliginicoccus lacisalsi TaxID=2742202 RepID=A0A927JCY1_9ACTN|nr:hypothetical protein [Lolliginicoccus lacisalsi]MBD8506875.1 hypothetical protein [Lolliginicoccus lacisalsi]
MSTITIARLPRVAVMAAAATLVTVPFAATASAQDTAELRVSATSAMGAPISNVSVSITSGCPGSEPTVSTYRVIDLGATGDATVPVAPGCYTVNPIRHPADYMPAAATPITAMVGESSGVATVRFVPFMEGAYDLGAAMITLVSPDGTTPVVNRPIVIRPCDGSGAELVSSPSDPSGRLATMLPAGCWHIIEPPTGGQSTGPVSFEVLPGQTAPVRLVVSS